MFLITVPSVGWIALNLPQDYQKAQGIIFPTAKPDELLVIVGKFDQRGGKGLDPTSRITALLRTEFKNAGIQNARVEPKNYTDAPTIRDEQAAGKIGEAHRATFVIWGWYDSAGFYPYFKITGSSKDSLVEVELTGVHRDLKDFNLYINDKLPAQMAYFGTFTVGQLYYQDGKYDEALRSFDVALANLKTSQGIENVSLPKGREVLYFYRGYIQQEVKQDLDQAIADYSQAIELNNELAVAYSNRGAAYWRKGVLDRAIADHTRAIELDPKDPINYINRGPAYNAKGEYDLAIADYNKAIGLNPKDRILAIAYSNRGNVYEKIGNYDQAISDYNKVLSIDSKDASAYYGLGNVHTDKKNYDQAFVDFNQAIALDPKFALAYNNRGNVYSFKGNDDRAFADYTKAIELDAAYAIAYNNHGVIYSKRGNYDLAIADFTKAIALDPQYAPAYINRGNAYFQSGNKPQAIIDFEKYLLLDPKTSYRTAIEQLIRELKGP